MRNKWNYTVDYYSLDHGFMVFQTSSRRLKILVKTSKSFILALHRHVIYPRILSNDVTGSDDISEVRNGSSSSSRHYKCKRELSNTTG